ncbi:hypothetical protein C0Q70_06249 [Pomacea canaliculata]|uniref:Uncharacterized protein n=1 Tax=Pomacea canaliculata TaxID=400727 RepID=A0A2T7PNJ1_POMCA|nr:hypothetical protein C0Q70_06249 [Pomacea canaliculata]
MILRVVGKHCEYLGAPMPVPDPRPVHHGFFMPSINLEDLAAFQNLLHVTSAPAEAGTEQDQLQEVDHVRVTLGQSQDFFNLIIDDSGNEDMRHEDQAFTVRVAAGQGKSVYFPIVPAIIGYLDLVVSAQSTRAADAVRRQLLVKAEGVPKQINMAVLVDLKTNHSFSKTVPISLPPNIVADSKRARVTAIGQCCSDI